MKLNEIIILGLSSIKFFFEYFFDVHLLRLEMDILILFQIL